MLGRLLRQIGFAVLVGMVFFGQVQRVLAQAPYGAFGPETTIDPAVMQIDESQYLGARLQPDYRLIDTNNREFTLGDMMGKPLILLFSYYGCDGTCPILNLNLKQVLRQIDRFKLGTDYRVLTVSFDQNDTPETLHTFMAKAGLPADMQAGWRHALLKQSDLKVKQLTSSVGYKYFWSRADQVFLHPNVLIFITPEGRIARYLYGTAIDKEMLELALIDTDWNRIANSTKVIDILTGVCYSYNFQEGKYTFNYSLFIGLGSLFFGIVLVVFSIVFFHFKKHKMRRLSHVEEDTLYR